MSHRADEVKVGVLVVVTVMVLFITVLMVSRSGLLQGKPHVYKSRFTFVGGLAQGAPVRFGGLTAGRVESVRVVHDKDTLIELEFSVAPETPVKRDSWATITSLGMLGDNYLEITLGTAQSELLPSGEYLKNKPSGLMSIMASAEDIGVKAEVVMGDIQKLVKDLNVQVNKIADKADVLMTDVDKVVGPGNQQRFSSILAETDQLIKEASPKVNDTLSQIQKAAAKIDPLMENFKATVKNVDKVLADIDAVVVENRPEIKKTLEDLDKALVEARGTILEVRSMLQYNRANLDVLIESLAASSDNIREFTDTVKQQPFSLIRMPSKKPRVPPEIRK